MPEFIRMPLVLFIACGLAAGSLSIVNMVTKEPIAAWEKKQTEVALREVFPEAETFTEMAAKATTAEVKTPMRVWEVARQGQPAGYVIRTETQGYSGVITIMFGVDPTQAITGMKVTGQTETPGLGAKVTTVPFREQFKMKQVGQIVLKKDDPSVGTIEAVTAATISSRAVTKAVAAALDTFIKEQGGTK
jgi:Na+-translocating ferredoxin:NAD+ oxidoreductase subunit G